MPVRELSAPEVMLKVVGWVDDDGLDADEVGLVGGFVGEGVGVGELAAGPVVDLGVGIGDGFAVDDLGDGEGDVVAPAGEVDEDAVVAGDGDAFGHGAVEGGDGFEVAEGVVGGGVGRVGGKGALGEGGGGEQRGGKEGGEVAASVRLHGGVGCGVADCAAKGRFLGAEA